ncbi:hypothetical protein [Halomicrococcus sp. NG-SE-24]|uniref:hypothetical protein n=1 Tax=Halomicrococcus sp. NG-SE-24 TaxID=3436928 RepID=UPI003D9790F2
MSSDRAKTVDTEVHQLAYAPVGNETEGTIKEKTSLENSEHVLKQFRYYIEDIVMKGDITKVTHASYSERSSFKGKLKEARDTDDEEEFRSTLAEWAEDLNERITANASEGSLLAAQATLSGGNIVDTPLEALILLKLDTEDSIRLFQSEDGIDVLPENRAYPSPNQIQKAAIYPGDGIPPHAKTGDIKIYQSNDSDYFEEFLQYDTLQQSSLEQARTALGKAEAITEESLDREFNQNDFTEIISQAEDGGELTSKSIGSALEENSDGEVDSEDVVDAFEEDDRLQDLEIDADDLPKKTKLTIRRHGGKITVKFPSSVSSNVEKIYGEDGEDDKIVIKGDFIQEEHLEK